MAHGKWVWPFVFINEVYCSTKPEARGPQPQPEPRGPNPNRNHVTEGIQHGGLTLTGIT